MTTPAPFVLAWAAKESPFDISVNMGAGADVAAMIAVGWVFEHRAQITGPVSFDAEPGPGLTIGPDEFPGTHTIVVASFDKVTGNVDTHTEAGMPPSALFYRTAYLILDCMYRFTMGRRMAEQAALAQQQQQRRVMVPAIDIRASDLRA
jgi:hypothetical protein